MGSEYGHKGDGEITGQPIYVVSLRLGDFNRSIMRVVGATQYDEAILGRDVLNQLIVTLNGLASVVEISD